MSDRSRLPGRPSVLAVRSGSPADPEDVLRSSSTRQAAAEPRPGPAQGTCETALYHSFTSDATAVPHQWQQPVIRHARSPLLITGSTRIAAKCHEGACSSDAPYEDRSENQGGRWCE